MESGQFQLHLGSIIPEEIISEVLVSLSQFADSADVRLTKGEVCHKTISADPNLIRQVLINLIGNGIKFSPPASTIVVTTEQQPDGIKFLVSDEGPGIDPEDMNKLFTKFQQLDASDTRLQSGSGLGLAISKTIVELHGGTIGVDSTVGEGSTFWFSLPFVFPS
jgi:signal transduction histidine kinase